MHFLLLSPIRKVPDLQFQCDKFEMLSFNIIFNLIIFVWHSKILLLACVVHSTQFFALCRRWSSRFTRCWNFACLANEGILFFFKNLISVKRILTIWKLFEFVTHRFAKFEYYSELSQNIQTNCAIWIYEIRTDHKLNYFIIQSF